MKLKLTAAIAIACLSLLTIGPAVQAGQFSGTQAAVVKKKLLWAEEFNSVEGTAPNPRFWNYDLGGGGWGNKELQWYTDNNVSTDGAGALVISAEKLPAQSDDDLPYECFGTCQYFSSRILTKGKLRFKYGRIETRIQFPSGTGTWPAFWLLGSNIDAKTWPLSGEIDVVELRGREPNLAIGTVHGPGYSGAEGKTGVKRTNVSLADGFHVYAIDWAPNKITWYLDGKRFHTVTSKSVPKGKYVFNQDFFLIMNLAMGGEFDGGQMDTSIEKAEYKIDYIRYYSLNGVGKLTRK